MNFTHHGNSDATDIDSVIQTVTLKKVYKLIEIKTMRSIVNISLPAELKKEVEKAVGTGQYATKSEFFRHLLRLWKEGQLSKELRGSKKEIAKGKGKILKSLKNLS